MFTGHLVFDTVNEKITSNIIIFRIRNFVFRITKIEKMLTCSFEAITFWNHLIFHEKCTVGIGRGDVVSACQTNEHT